MRRTIHPLPALVVAALFLAVPQGLAQAPSLPPAPVPVTPGAPAAPPGPGLTLGPPTPIQSGPGPCVPPPTGPFGSGPPACAPFEDRNGPLLKGDPLLDRPGDLAPGWFGLVDVAVVAPHVKNSLVAPVTLTGVGTDMVHAPQAQLDWTGSPRLGIGYHFAEGFGDVLVSYRFLVTDGTDNIPNFDILGDGVVHSRLNLNVVDIDYRSREYSLAPWWGMQWDVGVRVASVFFDSRADGEFLSRRTSNDFIGAGPHFGAEVSRRLDVPGLSAFAKVDGAFLLGHIDQSFEDVFYAGPVAIGGGAANQSTTQAVPVLSIEAGLTWVPCNDHMRFSLGYQFEQWWYLGQVGASRAELTDQGIFFRSEFNF
jgi:hypothetical protein